MSRIRTPSSLELYSGHHNLCFLDGLWWKFPSRSGRFSASDSLLSQPQETFFSDWLQCGWLGTSTNSPSLLSVSRWLADGATIQPWGRGNIANQTFDKPSNLGSKSCSSPVSAIFNIRLATLIEPTPGKRPFNPPISWG